MVDRVAALDPRHPLPRGQIPGQNPKRAKNHGGSAQPRDRGTAPGRTRGHHRSHPMGSATTTYYRAFPLNAAYNLTAANTKLTMPIQAMGGVPSAFTRPRVRQMFRPGRRS